MTMERDLMTREHQIFRRFPEQWQLPNGLSQSADMCFSMTTLLPCSPKAWFFPLRGTFSR